MKKYVLTGPPYSGKTTLLKELRKKGYETLSELSRILINEELKKELKDNTYIGKLPWHSQKKFGNLFFKRQLQREKRIKAEIIFLDRSLVDPLAYAKLANEELNPRIYKEIKKANYSKIFLFEILPNYIQDTQRKEPLEFALEVSNKLKEIYENFGFEIIWVPTFELGKKGIKKRLDLILENI